MTARPDAKALGRRIGDAGMAGRFGIERHLAGVLALACAFASTAPAAQPGRLQSANPQERIEYSQKRLRTITQTLATAPGLAQYRLVFLGDSITDFWEMGEDPG